MPFLVDNLSQALIAGNEGFPPLSRILFVFLQILLQDRSTKVSLEWIVEQIFGILHPVLSIFPSRYSFQPFSFCFSSSSTTLLNH